MVVAVEEIAGNKCFGGRQLRFRHASNTLSCEMTFSIYLPPQAEAATVPVLYWLSGLTCTDENFVTKAGAQQFAAQHGIAVVAPDTSPRGEAVPDDPDGAYDFGLGAGFYVNAICEPWNRHYQMFDYVSAELPALIEAHFPVDAARQSISGHSMGGHGAMIVALKNPGRFRSVSAFAPISSPSRCPWGHNALGGYLGEDQQLWRQWDSCALIETADERLPLLVDQGEADNFLREQLKPELLREACETSGYPLQLRMQPGYDHSYFFIASFIGDHMRFHSEHLL